MSTWAQATPFTYQGRLTDGGVPFTGNAEFQATLWEAANGGPALATNSPPSVIVGVTNGLFVLPLDFSANFPGAERWLQLEVRTVVGPFALLSPRQKLTATPYALTASNLSGTLPASRLTGTLVSAQLSGTYSAAVTFSNPANVFSGSFAGNGAGLSNVNATTWAGLSASNLWQVGGNNVSSNHFLGTVNPQMLDFKSAGQRVLRLQYDAGPLNNVSPSLIGGHEANTANVGATRGAVIAGGGTLTNPNLISDQATFDTISGGLGNLVSNSVDWAAIGGGRFNVVAKDEATIAGGGSNKALGASSSIGGGLENTSSDDLATVGGGYRNTSSGYAATVGGGLQGTSSGYAATVGGGQYNTSSQNYATVGGGFRNTNSASYGTVGGGSENISSDNYATVAGGLQNASSAYAASLGGGANNLSGGAYATVAGGHQNTNASARATIGGGDLNRIEVGANRSTIGGGYGNHIDAGSEYSVIAGGVNHIDTNSPRSAIVGGSQNWIQQNSAESFVGGGYHNYVSANAGSSCIAGGYGQMAKGPFATIPGGHFNEATNYAFAAGRRAKANHTGAFVWADSTDADFTSSTANQFAVRANGGVLLQAAGGGAAPQLTLLQTGNDFCRLRLGVAGYPKWDLAAQPSSTPELRFWNGNSNVAWLTYQGDLFARSHNLSSDRNVKENFTEVNSRDVLDKVAALPVTRWNFKDDPHIAHLGPMAQDFRAAFGLGPDDKHIATVDADGVALAAIQGLNQKLTEELKRRDAENAELKARLEKLERLMNDKIGGPR